MASVGLLYVGAVLFLNGLMLVGAVSPKGAAPLNYLVGVMQVVFPTLILVQSDGDPATIFAASGLFLFGFTYLYVAINNTWGLDGSGVGWFSLFVAVVAVVIGSMQFTSSINDPVFGVIWYIWAVLWFLFFLLLALDKASIGIATGWFTIIVAHITGTIPALFLLTGHFESNTTWAVVEAVAGVLALVIGFTLGKRALTRPGAAAEGAAA